MGPGQARWAPAGREVTPPCVRHAIVRRELARFHGRELDTAGDGFFASFDGPARAEVAVVAHGFPAVGGSRAVVEVRGDRVVAGIGGAA